LETYKHRRDHSRHWIKIHAVIDLKTGECIAAEITGEKGDDPINFPPLIRKSPKSVKCVYADRAMIPRNAARSSL
jgi:hypothetical protein